MDNLAILRAKVKRQTEQIELKARLQSCLDDQIRQAVVRTETIQAEAEAIRKLTAEAEARTQEVLAANEALRARIRKVEEQVCTIFLCTGSP